MPGRSYTVTNARIGEARKEVKKQMEACTFCNINGTARDPLVHFSSDSEVLKVAPTEQEVQAWPLAHAQYAAGTGATACLCPECDGIGTIGRDLATMDRGETCLLCVGKRIIPIDEFIALIPASFGEF